MTFTRFVEVGRVALINYGPDMNKLCTIIDVVDQTRVLVDGPTRVTGVSRQILSLKRCALTDFKVKIGRNARQKSLEKAWTAGDVMNKWNGTSWAKKLAAKKKRASNNDFARFKIARAKSARNKQARAKAGL
eukprot:g5878.t1